MAKAFDFKERVWTEHRDFVYCNDMNQTPHRLDLLTKKERRIMIMYGQGYSLKEIAAHFGNATKTILTYRESSADKLRIKRSNYRKVAFTLAAELMYGRKGKKRTS